LQSSIGVACYNLLFHPLSKYPGPTLWAAFRFPSLYAMLQGDLPYRIKSFHERYGPVVRIAPDELAFTDHKAWSDIYSKREFQRPLQWHPKSAKGSSDLISGDIADHSRFRRALLPAFSEKALKMQEATIQAYIDILQEKLEAFSQGSPSSSTVSLIEWIGFTVYDIISELGWGCSFNCLETRTFHAWIVVATQYRALLYGAVMRYYPGLTRLVQFCTPKSALAGLQLIRSTGEQNVRARLSKSDDTDFMHHVLSFNKKYPKLALTEGEMVANSTIMIIGGSDPSATVLQGAFNYLLKDQRRYDILAKEVRQAFSEERDITGSSSKSLAYLTAVLQEAMRLCPPTPDIMRRAVPRGGAVVTGYQLPAGITVGISCYAMFRSAVHFHEPDQFLPERWLISGEARMQPHCSEAFHPFGLGPRSCIGQSLAWLEMRLILARMLWRFDFQGASSVDWTSQKIYWAWNKGPLDVTLTRIVR
jgi:cytochrome P450